MRELRLWPAVGEGWPAVVLVRCGRQPDLYVEPAIWPGTCLGMATVCLGDRCDDGQAESGTRSVAGSTAEAAKRLKQPGYLVWRDALAAVGDGQLGNARVGPCACEHPAAGYVVPHGVVDEVAGQPFEEHSVSGDLHVLQRGVDPDLPGRGGRADQVDGVFDRARNALDAAYRKGRRGPPRKPVS